MANERTLMKVTIIEPESPPKVGGGNRVAESSSPQQHAEDSDGTALNPNGSAIPDDEQRVLTLQKLQKYQLSTSEQPKKTGASTS